MKNNLKSVQEHLKRASGSFLSCLRSRFTQKSGLVQNSKIHDELSKEILNPERLKNWLGKRAEWEIQALGLIYASGARGLHLLELESNLDVEQKTLKAFLSEAVSELFIWYAKCRNSYIYYGFTNFEEIFLNTFIKNESEPESAVWLSNDRKAELHLVLLLSKIQLRKISIKKDLSIDRVSKKHIAQIFSSEDEISLLFSFLISEKWISRDSENNILLAPPAFDFLQNNGFRLFSELIFWWERERFYGNGNLLRLLKFFEKPLDAMSAAWLFWPYDTYSRLPKNKSAIIWDVLPRPLRELWILGILKMQKKKHIIAFSLSEFGEIIFFAKRPDKNISEPIIACGSNFEWHLSQSNGPFRIFQMSCFAQAKNDEEPLRFALSKESFLNALRSNLPSDYVEDFLSWNKATPNVAAALNDWYRIYSDSSIKTMRILRIKNPEKYAQLAAYKPFLTYVLESIPNWGFIIKSEHEKKIREILQHFSLEPSFDEAEQSTQVVTGIKETENFRPLYPVPDTGNPVFD